MNIAKRMRLVDENYVNMAERIGKAAKSEDKLEMSDRDATKERIIKNLPKTYALKGAALIDFLLSKGISFDDENSLVIKGRKVKGTNFEDLVHDLLRPRDRPPPPGFDRLAAALSTANVSRELITNLERYQAIAQRQCGEETDVREPETSQATPSHPPPKPNGIIEQPGSGERKKGKPNGSRTKRKRPSSWITW